MLRRNVGRAAAAGSNFCVCRRPGAWLLHRPHGPAARRGVVEHRVVKIIKDGKGSVDAARDIKPHSVKVYDFGIAVLNKGGHEIISPPPSKLWWRDADQSKWSVVKNGPDKGKRTYALHQMPENPEVENAYIRESDGWMVIEWKDDFLIGQTLVQEISPYFINVWRRIKGPYSLLVKRALWDKEVMEREVQTVPAWELRGNVTEKQEASTKFASVDKHETGGQTWGMTQHNGWQSDAHLEAERTGLVKLETRDMIKRIRDNLFDLHNDFRRVHKVNGQDKTDDPLNDIRKRLEPTQILEQILIHMGIRQNVNLPRFDRVEVDQRSGQPRAFAAHIENRASPGVMLHTAHAYATDAPGIGIAFCLQNDVQPGGGALTFADGFRALTDLELEDPDTFLDLMTTRVMHTGYGLSYQAPIFRMYHEVLEWIRWDPLRRSLPYREEHCLPNSEQSMLRADNSLMRRRRAEVGLARRVAAPEHVYELNMKPGDMVLWNNRRVLNGSKAFTLLPGPDARRTILYAWLPWQDHKRVLDSTTRGYTPTIPVKTGLSSYEVGKDAREQRSTALGIPVSILKELPGFRSKRELMERDRCVEVMVANGMPFQDALAMVRKIQQWNVHQEGYKGREVPHEKPPYPAEELGRSGSD